MSFCSNAFSSNATKITRATKITKSTQGHEEHKDVRATKNVTKGTKIRKVLVGAACLSAVALLSAQSPSDLTEQFTRATALYKDGQVLGRAQVLRPGLRSHLMHRSHSAPERAPCWPPCVSESSRWPAEPPSVLSASDADAEALALSGDALWAAGFFDEADREYERALSVDSESARRALRHRQVAELAVAPE